MTEKVLLRGMRFIIILMGICGIAFDIFLVPITCAETYRGTAAELIQWIYQCAVSLPCFWLLILAWRVAKEMERGRVFVAENAIRIQRAAIALTASVAAFLFGKILFFALGWNTELLIHLIIAIMGITFTIIMMALSHYIRRAAELQEETDLTV